LSSSSQELLKAKVANADHSYVSKKFPDAECWARAGTHLIAVLGTEPDHLCWDRTHHLQGRVHVGDRELVVIAARDDLHRALVFTPEDWDEVRRSSLEQRGEMLQRCAIADHDRLVQVLAA
jgi:hypothetical protein